MKKQEIYHYYVEGEDEKKLLEVLKRDFGCIESGKVDKFNAVQKCLLYKKYYGTDKK